MVKINECVISVELANAIRGVADALGLKVPKGKLAFRCPNPDCRMPVKPMVKGGTPAHFEHVKRNPKCPLCSVPRSQKPKAAGAGA
jgi:rubredoxin